MAFFELLLCVVSLIAIAFLVDSFTSSRSDFWGLMVTSLKIICEKIREDLSYFLAFLVIIASILFFKFEKIVASLRFLMDGFFSLCHCEDNILLISVLLITGLLLSYFWTHFFLKTKAGRTHVDDDIFSVTRGESNLLDYKHLDFEINRLLSCEFGNVQNYLISGNYGSGKSFLQREIITCLKVATEGEILYAYLSMLEVSDEENFDKLFSDRWSGAIQKKYPSTYNKLRYGNYLTHFLLRKDSRLANVFHLFSPLVEFLHFSKTKKWDYNGSLEGNDESYVRDSSAKLFQRLPQIDEQLFVFVLDDIDRSPLKELWNMIESVERVRLLLENQGSPVRVAFIFLANVDSLKGHVDSISRNDPYAHSVKEALLFDGSLTGDEKKFEKEHKQSLLPDRKFIDFVINITAETRGERPELVDFFLGLFREYFGDYDFDISEDEEQKIALLATFSSLRNCRQICERIYFRKSFYEKNNGVNFFEKFYWIDLVVFEWIYFFDDKSFFELYDFSKNSSSFLPLDRQDRIEIILNALKMMIVKESKENELTNSLFTLILETFGYVSNFQNKSDEDMIKYSPVRHIINSFSIDHRKIGKYVDGDADTTEIDRKREDQNAFLEFIINFNNSQADLELFDRSIIWNPNAWPYYLDNRMISREDLWNHSFRYMNRVLMFISGQVLSYRLIQVLEFIEYMMSQNSMHVLYHDRSDTKNLLLYRKDQDHLALQYVKTYASLVNEIKNDKSWEINWKSHSGDHKISGHPVFEGLMLQLSHFLRVGEKPTDRGSSSDPVNVVACRMNKFEDLVIDFDKDYLWEGDESLSEEAKDQRRVECDERLRNVVDILMRIEDITFRCVSLLYIFERTFRFNVKSLEKENHFILKDIQGVVDQHKRRGSEGVEYCDEDGHETRGGLFKTLSRGLEKESTVDYFFVDKDKGDDLAKNDRSRSDSSSGEGDTKTAEVEDIAEEKKC